MKAIGIVRVDPRIGNNDNGFHMFGDIRAQCILEEIADPDFSDSSERYRTAVLVKVDAFSCNYRDHGVITGYLRSGAADPFVLFGSEISGTVVSVGKGVKEFSPGDRVIGDNSYPVARTAPNYPGVPTNHASCELVVFPHSKLFRIPDSIPVPTAAAMSLNGQTASSVARRIGASLGDPVLITAGKSNVSLMLLKLLCLRDVPCTVLTSSDSSKERFESFGAKEVYIVDRTDSNGGIGIDKVVSEQLAGKFHGIFDPYCDVYLPHVIPFLRSGGRYITCGRAEQTVVLPAVHQHDNSRVMSRIMGTAMINNLSIEGNCLGLPEDLFSFVAEVERNGDLVPIDSVYGPGDETDFVRQTFFSSERFGKVVYRFDG